MKSKLLNRLKRRDIVFIILFAVISLSIIKPIHSFAAYDGSRLIDNGVFLDASSMNLSQIQQFLLSEGSGLANNSFVLTCGAPGDTSTLQAYRTANAPCGQTVSAATIIFFASQIYGVNPRVVLATMQKEQSLVTDPNPTSWQINQAMGYACPDSGGCGASTFFYQVDNGTWVLRYHYERANHNNTWWNSGSIVCVPPAPPSPPRYYSAALYSGATVTFIDDNNVPYVTYTLANAATAALYCYTPHAYNNPNGLYGLPVTGTVGMYYSGSYNFVKWFEAWFGRTLDYPAHPDGTFIRDNIDGSIYYIEGGQRRHVNSMAILSSYLPMRGNWLKQATPLDKMLPVGANYSFSEGAVLRSPDGGIYITYYGASGISKRHITSMDAFSKLGYNYQDIITVSLSDLPLLNGPDIVDTTQHPDGTLVRDPSSQAIFYLEAGKKQHVNTMPVFYSLRGNSRLREMTASDLALPEDLNPLSYAEGTVLRTNNNPSIYVVDYNESGLNRRVITTQYAFDSLGYVYADILFVGDNDLPPQPGLQIQ